MKRLLFLLLIALVPLLANAQRVIVHDSIPFPTASDTTVYVRFYDVDNWSLSANYSALDDTDWTFDLAGVDFNEGTVFDRLDDLRLPFTLADSTLAFEKSNFSFIYLAIKFTPNSSTEGTITYTIIKR